MTHTHTHIYTYMHALIETDTVVHWFCIRVYPRDIDMTHTHTYTQHTRTTEEHIKKGYNTHSHQMNCTHAAVGLQQYACKQTHTHTHTRTEICACVYACNNTQQLSVRNSARNRTPIDQKSTDREQKTHTTICTPYRKSLKTPPHTNTNTHTTP